MINSVSNMSSVWYNSFLEKYHSVKKDTTSDTPTAVENPKKSETKEVDDYMTLKSIHRKKVISQLSKESSE